MAHPVRIAEYGGGERGAEFDAEAGPGAALVDELEAGQSLVDPANERAAFPDLIERRRRCERRAGASDRF